MSLSLSPLSLSPLFGGTKVGCKPSVLEVSRFFMRITNVGHLRLCDKECASVSLLVHGEFVGLF